MLAVRPHGTEPGKPAQPIVYKIGKEGMLRHEEVKQWCKKLLNYLNKETDYFEIMDEVLESRIVVIRNLKRKIDRWIREVKPKVE